MSRTPLDLVRLTTAYLAEKGVAAPRLDAEVLLAHVLGVPRIRLYTDFDKPLEPSEVDAYREAVRRRARREPVAYITGEREFRSLRFRVAPGVLVPRPETELLVEAALEGTSETGRILDLGTGSGCVLLSFLRERPGWTGVGVDVSETALGVARENAGALGVADRVELRQGDLFGPVRGERFDRVVSNPPYIPAAELATLEPEVSRFEPREALDGGPDGLEVIRRIAAEAPGHVLPGGNLALEFGKGQGSAVASILREAGFSRVEVRRDLAGIERAAVAWRPEG